MYNKIVLAGHLTRDIEMKFTNGGMAIASTAIASSRKFKSASGEQKEEVLFVDITFFGRTAEVANQYLRKGSKLLVDGRLKLDQWTAQDGTKRSKHSVTVETMTMLDNKGDNPQQGQPRMGNGGYNGNNNNYNQPPQQSQQNSYQNQNQNQNSYNQNNSYQKPQPQSKPAPEASIPTIDINEEEIPF